MLVTQISTDADTYKLFLNIAFDKTLLFYSVRGGKGKVEGGKGPEQDKHANRGGSSPFYRHLPYNFLLKCI